MTKIKILLVLVACVLGGCVTGTRNIAINVPDYADEKKASGNVYIGAVNDNRQFEQKPSAPSTPSVKGDLNTTSKDTLSTLIGRQRNGYGAAMGDVALIEGVTVPDRVRALIAESLESRGYTVVDDKNSPNKVTVDIAKFWAWFSPGMWAVSFESEVECGIEFDKNGTKKSFDVRGYGVNKGQVASDANWDLAYQRAFENFLENLDASLGKEGL